MLSKDFYPSITILCNMQTYKNGISVIMPVYNTEMYLKKAIDCVLNQTYKDIELIIVNDGSTDSSGAICRYYMRKYPNIRYYETENRGVASARNYGVEKSTRQYVGFVDSDDTIEPDMYSKLHECITEEQADISACAYNKIGADGRVIYTSQYYKNVPKRVIDNNVLNMAYVFGYGTDILPNKLFRSEIIKEIRLAENKTYEDIMAMPMLLKASNRIVYINDVLYHYQLRNNNITSDDSWKGVLAFLSAKKDRFVSTKDEGGIIAKISADSLLTSVIDWEKYSEDHPEYYYDLLADMSSYFPCLQDDDANKIKTLFKKLKRERRT